MIRFILYFAIALLVWKLFFNPRKTISKRPQKTNGSPSSTPNDQTLVPCAYCHVYIPLTEAITDHHHYYCCPEHQSQHRHTS